MPVLEFDQLYKHFGGVAALSDVSFSVDAGEIHAVVGENGAGKSTLMKCLVGVHRADKGAIRLSGHAISPANPEAARARGSDVVFQEIELAQNLTVAQSICLAREPTRFGMIDRNSMRSIAASALERVGVPISPDAPIEDLRTAEKQGVQIARALAQGASILIMDEPTSSLSDHEVERLMTVLESLRSGGTTILYVSHKLEEIFRLANTITVLRDGRHVATQPRSELNPDALISLMAGPDRAKDPALDATAVRGKEAESSTADSARVALSAENVGNGRDFSGVSFDLHEGEVLGLFGIVGAGRTEVSRAIFGLDPLPTGHLKLRGESVRFRTASAAIARGLALVPEDRKLQGLILDENLRRNIALPAMSRVTTLGAVSRRREYALAGEAVKQFGIVARAGVDQEAQSLSGGNQQKVVLAKWLATKPTVLILDEPTKGIDVGAKREVHEMVRQFAKSGLAVLLISSELEEVMGLADRIMVMRAGRVAGILPAAGATRDALLKLAVQA